MRFLRVSVTVWACVWAQGNFGIGTLTPTERLDVEGGRLRVRAYSGTGTRIATVDPTGVFGVLAGNAVGDVLQWNGTAWVAAPAPSTAVQTQAPLQGNGTAGSPLTFQNGTAAGQVWQWNGTQWVLAANATAVSTASPIQGDGINNPITFAPGTAAGQVWQWDGTQWVLAIPTATTTAPIIGDGTTANPIRLQPGGNAPQILLWNPATSQWQIVNVPLQNGLNFNLTNPPGNPAIELGGALVRDTDIPLAGFNLTFSGANGRVGIGTATPTERLHVEGNLRLQGAFMPNNNAGTNGSLLLSAGAGTPPTWLAPGAVGTVLTIGAGGTPTWSPAPLCGTATLNRLLKFTSTTPPQACNTTLAENAQNGIWNADGAAAPFAGDKFSIYGTSANPWVINAYASTGGLGGAGVFAHNAAANGTAIFGIGSGLAVLYALTSGSGGAFTGSQAGVYARADNITGDRAAGLFVAMPNNLWLVGAVIAGTPAKIAGPGFSATLVSTPGGGFRDKLMFAPEAPEVLIMDFGRGHLQEGRAYISLDPIFAHNIIVDEAHPLRVYIQLEGDCEGVYVVNKSEKGFEVRELRGGRSNAPFSWFVVANRKDEVDPNTGEVVARYQDVRFLPAPKFPEAVRVRKPKPDLNKERE